ncbi:MAG: hypothetical protein MR957_02740 [Lachnobacterium sp.]|nr:hypothetical protein [Lachnobacterium sp.]
MKLYNLLSERIMTQNVKLRFLDFVVEGLTILYGISANLLLLVNDRYKEICIICDALIILFIACLAIVKYNIENSNSKDNFNVKQAFECTKKAILKPLGILFSQFLVIIGTYFILIIVNKNVKKSDAVNSLGIGSIGSLILISFILLVVYLGGTFILFIVSRLIRQYKDIILYIIMAVLCIICIYYVPYHCNKLVSFIIGSIATVIIYEFLTYFKVGNNSKNIYNVGKNTKYKNKYMKNSMYNDSKFDYKKSIKEFKKVIKEKEPYSYWKQKIIDKISLLDKKQIEDYRILLELKMKKCQNPAKFDLKTIACNIIVPIYLGVAIAVYTIFSNAKLKMQVFDISLGIFIVLMILVILMIICDYKNNKKNVETIYCIEQILKIMEEVA